MVALSKQKKLLLSEILFVHESNEKQQSKR